MPGRPLPAATPSSSLYRSISELPLAAFRICIVHGDLSALVISGDPTEDEISKAWDDIRQQYADAIGDHDHRLATSLYKDIAILKYRYKSVILLVDLLQDAYMKELADELNDLLATTFPFDPHDTDQYLNDLQRCVKRTKAILLELEVKEQQYKNITAANGKKGSRPTDEYFLAILITLSDHAKYQVNESITVFEFCERLKRYNHYVETLQKQKRK